MGRWNGRKDVQMSDLRQILRLHGDSSSKLTVRNVVMQDDEMDDDGNPIPPEVYALIEGDRDALRFLAEAIIAQIDSDNGCTLSLHPFGAGSSHFSQASSVGLYIHRLPCDLHPGEVIR